MRSGLRLNSVATLSPSSVGFSRSITRKIDAAVAEPKLYGRGVARFQRASRSLARIEEG